MMAQLLAMYEQGSITADHLAVETLHILDPSNPALVLEVLPNDLLQQIMKYVREYRPGKMRTNYDAGKTRSNHDLHPAIDQVEAAKRWIEQHQQGKVLEKAQAITKI